MSDALVIGKPEPDDLDALTTDPEVRIRQLRLIVYSARGAAEKAAAVYRSAVQRMHVAELAMHRAVKEQRERSISESNTPGEVSGVSHLEPESNRARCRSGVER